MIPTLTLETELGDLTDFGEEPRFDITRGATQLVTAGAVGDPGSGSTLLTNESRALDPDWSEGLFFGDIVPGLKAQFIAGWGSDFPVLSGRIDGWPQGYDQGTFQSVDFKVTDALESLANSSAVMTRPAERTGERIAAVLAAVGYAGATAIAAGMSIVPAIRREQITAGSHITDCVQVEFGELFIVPGDDLGTLTFRGRAEMLGDERSTVSQADFVQSGGLNYVDLERVDLPIWNEIVAGYGTKGKQVVVRDEVSIAAPWSGGVPRTLTLSLPFATESQARGYCRWMLLLYANPRRSFTKLTLDLALTDNPGDDFDLWAQALGRQEGDLVTVALTPNVDGALSDEPLTGKGWIRGVHIDFQNSLAELFLQDAWWLDGLFYWDSSDLDGPDIYGL